MSQNINYVVDDEDNFVFEAGNIGLIEGTKRLLKEFVRFLSDETLFERLFVAEIKIESTLGDAGTRGDLLNGNFIKAALQEKLIGRFKNTVVLIHFIALAKMTSGL